MNKKLPDIENLFKSALEDNEERPPERVWDDIENTLNKDDIISIKRKYDNLKKTALLLFFLLTVLTIYELNGPRSKANLTVATEEMSSEKNTDSDSKNKKALISSDQNNRTNLNGNTSGVTSNDKSIAKKNDFGKPRIINSNTNFANTNPDKFENGANKNNKYQQLLANINVIPDKKDLFPTPVVSPPYYAKKESAVIDTPTSEIIGLLNPHNNSLPTTLTTNSKGLIEERVRKKAGKSSPFYITAFFSPDFASYRLQDDQQNNEPENAAQLEKNEHHEFSSSIGALIEYRFKKHVSIESGLTFSNTNITAEPKIIYAQNDNKGNIKYRLNASSGYGYVLPSFSGTPSVGDSLNIYTSTHTLQYVSLPVLMKYNFPIHKFGISVMLGAAGNFLTKGKIETSVDNGTNNEIEVVNNLYGLKKAYFSGLTGIGIDYNINNKLAISFNPAFRYAFNSINKNTPVKSFPNSFMLPFGLKIKL